MRASNAHVETKDTSTRDGWSAWRLGHPGDERQPRLRLLYHADLGRIGALSMPGVVAARWLAVGRNDPHFVGLGDATLPIDDPHVSREQLRIRFRSDAGRFEVEPVAGARRPLGLLDLHPRSPGAPAASPIAGPTLLEPGACVAIGDRVLLGLELSRVRQIDADRLGLVGESEEMWALREEIASIARFGGAALVTGPTGAGKELVVRALHRQSPRAAGPFVPVNCAALPEALVEAVLFGHRKGAFTGAEAEGKGLFSAAEGGTLFLDEVGELPLSVQPKLLRVLQDGVVVPVGAYEGRRVDVRVVAATHRDLEAQVREGGLREDLYHRLTAHVLRVPSLAERRFDVPELFVRALVRLRDEHPSLAWMWEPRHAPGPALPIGFVAELLRRPFRGNVRELENLAERTARLNLHPGAFHTPDAPSATVATFSEASLARAVPSHESTGEASGPRGSEVLLQAVGEVLGLAHKTVLKLLPPDTLAALGARAEREGQGDAERAPGLRAAAAEALLALLEAHSFNQSAVAAALGTSRTTLIKLMSDLDLPRATDLTTEDIARARRQAGGDLDAAARLLRVSPKALKKRLTLLNLRARS